MRNKVIAVVLGLTCHVMFLAAIISMAYMLFFGLTRAIYPIGGTLGRELNIILVLQFPLVHSFFLSRTGQKMLTAPFPSGLGQNLISTTFALLASLQLLAVFVLWTPDTSVWIEPHGIGLSLTAALYVASWSFLVKALHDSGIALQSGFLGWSAVAQGKDPHYPGLNTTSTYKLCRQPIYLGFTLVLLTAPTWSLDHFLLATVWGAYCLIGPMLKERRLLARYGESYKNYQNAVPYFFPRLGTAFRQIAVRQSRHDWS